MTTTKQLTFTQEQKSLIWTTKLHLENANEADAKVFVELCESYGLNPLEGDILFQKRETQYGPRVQYTVTRDGHLKFAMKDPNFINILSCVVRKNDAFKVDVLEGVPVHEFSAERGEIVGAWCVVKHKVRGNMFVYVDFDEYFKAFSPKSPVWKAMPSAMIEKIAMVQGLRRSFPLGVHFRSEDEVIDLYEDEKTSDANAEQTKEENLLLMSVEEFSKTPQAAALKDSPKVEDKAEQKPTEKTKRKTKTAAEKKAEKEAKEANELKADTAAKIEEGLKAVPTVQPAHNIISLDPISEPLKEVVEEILQNEEQSKIVDKSDVVEIIEQPKEEIKDEKETILEIVDQPSVEKNEKDTSSEEIIDETKTENDDASNVVNLPEFPENELPVYEFLTGERATTTSEAPVLKVFYKDEAGNRYIGFARGVEQIERFDEFDDNAEQKFSADIKEHNGFNFILDAVKVG